MWAEGGRGGEKKERGGRGLVRVRQLIMTRNGKEEIMLSKLEVTICMNLQEKTRFKNTCRGFVR